MSNEAPTEPLTDEMITALRIEAGAHGDTEMCCTCSYALGEPFIAPATGYALPATRQDAREYVADAINDARFMDDSKPFVRVVAE